MSSSENDSDISEDQLANEQEEDSSDEEASEEEDSDDAGGDSEGEEQEEDDSDDDEEDDDSDDAMMSPLKTKTDIDDIKQKKGMPETPGKRVKVSKANIAEESPASKSKIENDKTSGSQPLSLFIRHPQGLVFDEPIAAKIKEFCPLVTNVVIDKRKMFADFASVEDCKKGLTTLRNFQMNGQKMFVVFKRSPDALIKDKPTKSIFFKSASSSASLDEIMSHFPEAVSMEFKKIATGLTALISFRTIEEAQAAREKQIKIAGESVEIVFGKFFLKNIHGSKWSPHPSGPGNRQPPWASPGNKRPHWAGPGFKQQMGPQTGWTNSRKPVNMQKRAGDTKNGGNQEGPTRKVGTDEIAAIPAKKAKQNSETTTKSEMNQHKSGKKEKAANVEQQLERGPNKRKFKLTENGSNQATLKAPKGTIKNITEAKNNKPAKKNFSQSPVVKEDKLSKVLKQLSKKVAKTDKTRIH